MSYEQYLYFSPAIEEPINELNFLGFNIGGNKNKQPESPKKSYMEQRRERARLLNGNDDEYEDRRRQESYRNFINSVHNDAAEIRQRNGWQTPDYLTKIINLNQNNPLLI